MRVDAAIGPCERHAPNGGVREHERADAVSVVNAQVRGDGAAQRKPHDMRAVHVEEIEQPRHIVRVEYVPSRRRGRAAKSAHIVANDAVPGVQEGFNLRRPHAAVEREAVDQEHRRAVTLVALVDHVEPVAPCAFVSACACVSRCRLPHVLQSTPFRLGSTKLSRGAKPLPALPLRILLAVRLTGLN